MRLNSYTFSMSRLRGSPTGTVQINMAPMIDFLVIMIAYLLMSASFCSIGLIDSVSSASGGATSGATAVTKTAEVTLKQDGSFQVSLRESNAAEVLTEEPNVKAVLRRLQPHRSGLASIALGAEPGSNYGRMIETLGELRQISPQVSLNVSRPGGSR